MKKIAILLVILLLTGCTTVRIDTANIDNTIDIVLSKKNSLYNRIGKGYKYYIPRGMKYVDTIELNDKIYSNGIYYYLYIDAISYYYKTELDIASEEDVYYYKKIEKTKANGKKEGYVKIVEFNNKYKIEFVFNYSKIETVVDKKDIENAILNSAYILSTVKFNDNVIKLMLDEDYFTNKEERYDLFVRKETEDYFLVEETEE